MFFQLNNAISCQKLNIHYFSRDWLSHGACLFPMSPDPLEPAILVHLLTHLADTLHLIVVAGVVAFLLGAELVALDLLADAFELKYLDSLHVGQIVAAIKNEMKMPSLIYGHAKAANPYHNLPERAKEMISDEDYTRLSADRQAFWDDANYDIFMRAINKLRVKELT